MASGIYDVFKVDLMDGTVDLAVSGDSIKCALLDDSHSFTATDTNWAAISTNEATGTGYTAGGVALSTASMAVTIASNVAKFDHADAVWTSADFTAYHAVLYSVTNSNSLIASLDFGGAKTVSGGGSLTVQWSTGGIVTLATA